MGFLSLLEDNGHLPIALYITLLGLFPFAALFFVGLNGFMDQVLAQGKYVMGGLKFSQILTMVYAGIFSVGLLAHEVYYLWSHQETI